MAVIPAVIMQAKEPLQKSLRYANARQISSVPPPRPDEKQWSGGGGPVGKGLKSLDPKVLFSEEQNVFSL